MSSTAPSLSAATSKGATALEARSLAEAVRDFVAASARANADLLAFAFAAGDLLLEAVVRPDAPAALRGLRWICEGATLCTGVVGVGAARAARALRTATDILRGENNADGLPSAAEVQAEVERALFPRPAGEEEAMP